jgi:antitoxin component of MazEF toxin-antitoxin module
MEIKCKVSFALPEELMKVLGINDDTSVISYIENGRVIVEIVDDEEDFDDDEDFDDNEDFTEDDLYDEDDFDCDEDECEYCEYYCQHCGKCVLN